MSLIKQDLTRGIIHENPTFRLLLGMCPTLAVTTLVINGLGMGLATTFVLICSNLVISAVRQLIPDRIRIPCFIMIIATFVTIAEMLLRAYQPDLYAALGVFIPLIVVNCIILGRAEAFASKNPLGRSLIDGLGYGVGFTLALLILSAVRELLGKGTLLGINIMGSAFEPMSIFGLPPGAFIALGLLLALMNVVSRKLGID
ncbi:MAG: electron transport complex subunit RsxE [Dethiobacteria bacterium]|jgi:electron transport complex protein RnfE|nr:electron transport complex subunit E [Bacillota bacterium]